MCFFRVAWTLKSCHAALTLADRCDAIDLLAAAFASGEQSCTRVVQL